MITAQIAQPFGGEPVKAMPQLEQRRVVRRRIGRTFAVLIAALLAIPVAAPSAALGVGVAAPREKGSGGVGDALIVQFRAGLPDTDAALLLARAGVAEIGRFDEAHLRVVSVSSAGREPARAALLRDPRVASVENDEIASTTVNPNDPGWDRQWGPRKIRAPEAWELTRGSPSTVIAVVDTGVDPNQADLRGRVLSGWDFQNNDSNAYDDDGHGTAVATTAAGAGNDGVGIVGMCWRCRILPVKVLNSSGHGTHSNIAAGIVWATNHGADVINLSIAGLNSTTILQASVAYAIRKGVVVVAAAGNDGSARRTYPAAYVGVVSVAATNGIDALYDWSNRGSWVTMSAPGCAYSGRPRAGYDWLCGTSMAAPVVSGTVGLMRSVSAGLDRSQVAAALTGNTQRIRAQVAHGRLDAARAIRSVLGSNPRPQPPSPSPTPTPRPTPPRASVDWSGDLSPDNRWDRKEIGLRGAVRVRVRWSTGTVIALFVVNDLGTIVGHKTGTGLIQLQLRLPAGRYEVTVAESVADSVRYQVTIESEGP